MIVERDGVTTIYIKKKWEKDYGLVIVRKLTEGEIGLTVSLKANGDVMIELKKDDCLKIVKALEKAIQTIEE
jgi:hypothetical protein